MSARQYHVLLYHGVHPDELELGTRNSSGKHISRSRFDEEMALLSQTRPLVTMRQIAGAHRGEVELPDGAVAVNFDDGFLNNYTEAWPVLEKHRVPATFYLATGYIGTGRMMWSDRLEAVVLGTEKDALELTVNGHCLNYPLRDDEERTLAFLEIKAWCKAQSNEHKDQTVAAIDQALATTVEPDHPLYTFMNWSQAREMDASPLVDFGAHTIDHVSLARVTPDEMRRQIDESVSTVAAELGHPCELFSYPEGQAGDYNDEVITYLRRLGFDHAPSAIDGINRLPGTDPFYILRNMVGFEGRPFPLPS